MKRILNCCIFLLFFCSINYAQNIRTDTSETKNTRKCGTMEYMKQQKAIDPTLESRLQQMENFTQQWIKDHPEGSDDKTVVTIPVVVHIIYANTAQNLSDTRVQEQITALNRDYAGLNTHSMGAFSTSLKANTELQFCLAKRTPSGAYTTGIERRQTTVTSFSTNDDVKHYSKGGLDAWTPTKYMNIWVCNLTGSICGYAEFPTANLSNNYGVVIHYKFFGCTGATAPYNLGGTTTHEIGHCFNLYHIWGDDNSTCSGNDYCIDTPNQSHENYGCPSTIELTDACTTTSPGIMYMNFMDYSDDACYSNFTPNQKSRIQACFATGGPLVSLKTSNGCTPGVGIAEQEILGNVNIYPNPSNGFVNVNFALNNSINVVISVSNILGEEIKKIYKQNVSYIDIPIDLTNQTSGIYFVIIQSGKQIITQKVSLIK